MARITRRLVALALILLGAGIAVAATSPIAGPPVQMSLPTSPLTQITPTATSVGGTTVTTVGDTTTVTGSTTPVATPGTTVPTTTTPGTTAAIERVLSVTRAVDAGAPVSAFAVPAGSRLVITDVIITNPGTAPACGASVAGSGATTVASTPAANTTPASAAAVTTSATTDIASTGVLCVPAQTSLTLTLTTGLEFTSGQNVVLANQVATGSTSGGQLFYHLRGFLISGAV